MTWAKFQKGEKAVRYMKTTNGVIEWHIPWCPYPNVERSLEPIRTRLRSSKIFPSKEPDKLMWIDDKRKMVKMNVSSVYHKLNTNKKDPRKKLWRRVWQKQTTPKITCFMWAVALNRIHTNDNLKKKGMIFLNHCILCMKDEEDVSHLLIRCDFASQIWARILEWTNYHWVEPPDLAQLIDQWALGSQTAKAKEIEIILLMHVVWSIWKERNAQTFLDRSQTANVTLQKEIKAFK